MSRIDEMYFYCDIFSNKLLYDVININVIEFTLVFVFLLSALKPYKNARLYSANFGNIPDYYLKHIKTNLPKYNRPCPMP